MKLGHRNPPLTLIVVAALFGLLALLAVLQHRWLGEVSQGERERMQANLRVAASHFTQEIDGELMRAFLAFQMDASVATDRTRQYYADLYAQWSTSAAHPRLVKELLLVENGAGGRMELARLNATTGSFEPAAWPPELVDVRRRLDEHLPGSTSGPLQIIRLTIPPLDDVAPALLIPLVTLPQSLQPAPHLALDVDEKSVAVTKERRTLSLAFALRAKAHDKPAARPSFGYAIVLLDLEYINRELIPALTARYFSSSGALDYNVAIVSRRDRQQVIFKSDWNMSEQALASPDLTADLFALRLDKAGTMLADSLLAGRGGPASGRPGKLSYRVFNYQQIEAGDGSRPANDFEGRWQLLLSHRAGSLETVVAASRRRNLIISFGILLLLAVSLTMIMISTQRAQRLARQQMEFVAGVSHELRTPLAVICSAGENLADGVIDDREQIRRYGAVIRNEGRRLTQMVEQVLEFAGIQSGRKAYNMTSVDVSRVIEDVLAGLGPSIASEGFHLEKEIASSLPAVRADSAALGRAIQNLVENAMKYSGESRWIGVSARTETRDGKSEIQIAIRDRGMGIAPSELPHIFEPFQRGQASVAAQIHGNGLGLSLVKHIAEVHGGRVEVNSVEGEGSSFILHLPTVVEGEPASVDGREMIHDS
jgi:signal transduction histidine kinase